MPRHYFALDLHNDAETIRAYEAWHRPDRIWPDIVTSIRAAGVRDMEIFRTGNRLVLMMDVEPGFDAAAKASADAANPRVQAWERLMEQFQQHLPWAGEGQKWVPMRQIFSLAACPA